MISTCEYGLREPGTSMDIDMLEVPEVYVSWRAFCSFAGSKGQDFFSRGKLASQVLEEGWCLLNFQKPTYYPD